MTEEQKQKNRENSRRYYQRHKEEIKERQREYRKNNKDKIKELHRKYRENNRDKVNERNRKWYENNREHLKEYRKNYYNNPENKAKLAKYYQDNKEELDEKNRKWRENNRKHFTYLVNSRRKEVSDELKAKGQMFTYFPKKERENRMVKHISIKFEIDEVKAKSILEQYDWNVKELKKAWDRLKY